MPDTAPTRLGVLGGTFDPLHRAHLTVAEVVAARLSLDRVIFVPTGEPWQKEHYSSAEDRFMMATLGVAGDPMLQVSRIEIDRRGPTYTLDTMIALHDFYGSGTEAFFIAGADAVLQLGTWKGIERLGEYCDVIAVTRPGTDLTGFEPQQGWPRILQVEMEPQDVSATDIRRRVRDGLPIDELVPPAVAEYIERRKLYRAAEERAGA
jgi:nicotinate-nucleotide adenylyltransferase